ncbi:MAG: DHA2 family efflux MFS transporter permease subunit [Chloroflexi bacterium]|nr:DHA2 family efflux MFS transporter permease subunit [Chloroflexota bacterium]
MSDTGLPTRQALAVFGVVALALMMAAIDMTIVAVALPKMLVELQTNLAWIGWTLTGYQLALTIVMPLAGKLSDDWGRKRLFLGAAVLFTLTSAATGMASSVHLLIVFRILQAVGGGTFLPSATGIVSDAFGSRRGTAIGLFTSIFPLGGVFGPNIGGFLIDNFSWRWIFYVNVPIGIALIVLGALILPSDHTIPIRRKIDLVGAALFAAMMVSLLYAMTIWGNEPSAFGDPAIWTLLGLAVVLLIIFLRRESRTEEPMMDLTLFRWRPFFAANVFNLIYGASVFGFFSFIPYYAVIGYNMSAVESGLILTPRSLMMVVMSAVSSFFLIRFGYRLPMIVGTIFISLSLFLMSAGYHNVNLLGVSTPDIVLLSLMVIIAGFGMGISAPAANNAALDLLPGKVAAVAGIRGMFRTTGGVLGTAVIVLVLSHFPDKAAGVQDTFFALGILILLVIPFIFMIPDVARQRRAAETARRDEAAASAEVDPE